MPDRHFAGLDPLLHDRCPNNLCNYLVKEMQNQETISLSKELPLRIGMERQIL